MKESTIFARPLTRTKQVKFQFEIQFLPMLHCTYASATKVSFRMSNP